MKRPKRPCKHCGALFTDRGPGSGIPRSYCSLSCHEKDTKKPVVVERKRGAGIRRTQTTQTRKAISPASPAQRAKRSACIVTGGTPADMAHLWPRGMGGCDEASCVVPLVRPVHRALDDGQFDVLPYLIAHGCVAELQHALGHANGDLVALIERVTGCRVVLVPRTELLTLEQIERRAA